MHFSSESVKAAELAHKAAEAESLPKLSFEGTWNEQGQTFNTMTPGYDYRANVRFPIFTGGRLGSERKSTALAAQRAMKQLAEERDPGLLEDIDFLVPEDVLRSHGWAERKSKMATETNSNAAMTSNDDSYYEERASEEEMYLEETEEEVRSFLIPDPQGGRSTPTLDMAVESYQIPDAGQE